MRTKLLMALVVLAMLTAACGGATDSGGQGATTVSPSSGASPSGDAGSTTTEPESQEDAKPIQQQQASVEGSITIDGEPLGVVSVFRCEPYVGPNDVPHEADLDLVAQSTAGQYLSIVVSNHDGHSATAEPFSQQRQEARVNTLGDAGQEQFVAFASHGIEGNWFLNFLPVLGAQDGDNPLNAPPFDIGDSRISGTLPLIMDYPTDGGAEMDVSFDLPIPSDLMEC